MGIAFDSNAGHSTSKSASATSIVTSNITLVQNQLVIVGVAILNNTTSVSSVTDSLGNTYSLSKVAFTTSQIRVELWTTKHTTGTGTATVTVTIGIAEKTDVAVIQYSGVVLVSSNTGSNTGTGTATSVSLTTQSPLAWEVGVVGLDNSHVFAAGSGTNQRLTLGANSTAIGMADSGEIVSQGTNKTLNETAGASSNWAFASVELQSINFNQVSASDTNTVSDSTQKKKSVMVSESGAVSETVFRKALPIIPVETISVSDTTKKSLLFLLSSVTTIAETLTKTGLLSRSEAIAVADALVLSKSGKNMFETTNLFDSTFLTTYRSVSETASSISEILQLKNLLLLDEDDIDLEEFLDRRASFSRQLDDTPLSVSDSLNELRRLFTHFYRTIMDYNKETGLSSLQFFNNSTPVIAATFDNSIAEPNSISAVASPQLVIPIDVLRQFLNDAELWIGEVQKRYNRQPAKLPVFSFAITKNTTAPHVSLSAVVVIDGQTVLASIWDWNNDTQGLTLKVTTASVFGIATLLEFLRIAEETYRVIQDMITKNG